MALIKYLQMSSMSVKGVLHLFNDIKDVDIQRPTGEIDVLVGYEYGRFHPVREQSVVHLVILNNQFRKCLSGTHQMVKEKTQIMLVQHIVIHHMEHVKLEDFYSTEAMGVQCYPKCGSCKCGSCPIGGKNYTLKKERELNLIDKGLRHEDRYWLAKYHWIKDPNNLLDNKQAVMGMLKSTEKHMSKNRKHAEMYQQQIDDMIQCKGARKLPASELEEYRGTIHYISHHEVLKPDYELTPCRIVFSSSAKYQGHTLNEYWAKGPDLLNNLLGVLIRFRENRIAISGDIRKMYHAVKIDSIGQHTPFYGEIWKLRENQMFMSSHQCHLGINQQEILLHWH